MPRVSRRIGLLAAVAALALTGCSTFAKGSTAAFVNGQSISKSEVADVTQQYNDTLSTSAQDRLQEPQTLGLLILAPFVLNQAKASGSWVPDERYNAALAKVPDALPGTKDLVGVSIALQPGILTDADVTAIVDGLKKANVQLDPRYGTFDPSTGGFLAPDNNWIRPTATPAPGGAPTATPAPTATATATAPATTGP
ncbi:MAG: hypothetical protein ABJA89_17540 [Lapillicoccus sp.]